MDCNPATDSSTSYQDFQHFKSDFIHTADLTHIDKNLCFSDFFSKLNSKLQG